MAGVTLIPPNADDTTPAPVTLIPPADAKPSPVTLIPPSAPETKPVTLQPPQPSIGSRVFSAVADIPKEVGTQANQSFDTLKGDFKDPNAWKSPDLLKGLPANAGALASKGVTDAASYIFSPITGAATSIIGRPVEALENKAGLNRGQLNRAMAPLGVRPSGKPTDPMFSKQDVGNLASAFVPLEGAGIAKGLERAVSGVRDSDAVKAVQSILAPTSMGEGAGQAERTIRRAGGEADINTERAAQTLLKDNKIVGNLPVDQQRGLVNYIENRSRGVPIPDKKLQPSADNIADVYDKTYKRAQYLLPEDQRPGFIRDYYSHLWRESPQTVDDTLNTMRGRQGSSRSTKERTIPTIAEGIQAGLTPRIENPIENTMAYVRNMNRFIATNEIQTELKGLGYAKHYAPGAQPQGWVPLNGILTEKTGVYMDAAKQGEQGYVPHGSNSGQIVNPLAPRGAPMKLYAPENVARVYNNYAGHGFEHGTYAPLWTGARMASNALTGLKMGLSGFHAVTMANEAMTSELARSVQALSRGDLKTAGRAAINTPVAPVTTYLRGNRMQKELLGTKAPGGPLSDKVNEAYVRSGQRLKMDPFYNSAGAGSFLKSMHRGTFFKDVKDLATSLGQGNVEDGISLASRAFQTMTAPLFEDVIPKMKQGAFANMMEDWHRANPAATQREIDDAAIKIGDSVDNRFGELVQDNLFWDRHLKQALQILLFSPTWKIGTAREIGGGLADLPRSARGVLKGQGVTARTAYNVALAAMTSMVGGIGTYLMTGQKPEGRDFIAPRTGGKTPQGSPERLQVPGYSKDVIEAFYNFPHNLGNYATNSANPALSSATDLAANKDYRGFPIYPEEGAQPHSEDAPLTGSPLGDYLINSLTPIALGQANGRKQGSAIPDAAAIAGFRPSPQIVEDPDRAAQIQQSIHRRDWRKKEKSDARLKAQEAQ